MISLVLASLFQAPSADVARANPEMRREQRIITLPPPISFPDEMRPAVEGYMDCLKPGGRLGSGAASLEGALRSRIELCQRTREWAVSTALLAYKPKRRASAGRAEVADLFRRLEEQELRNVRNADDQINAAIGSSGSASKGSLKVDDPATKPQDAIRTTVVTRSEPFPIPPEFIPAVIPYLNCLSFSAGIPVRRNGRELKPTVATGGSCAAERAKAATNSEASLRQSGVRNADERRRRVEAFLQRADAEFGQQRPTRLTLPPEIRAEVSPYVTCRLSGAACVGERTKAATDAEAALVRAGTLSAEQRRAFINGVFNEIDRFLPPLTR